MSEWLPLELNKESFSAEIEREDYPVFIDFWAVWCPPCRMMDPIINQLAEEYVEKVLVRKLNTDLNRSIADQFGIMGVPTYIIFKGGKEVWRQVGAASKKDFQSVFKNILFLEV